MKTSSFLFGFFVLTFFCTAQSLIYHPFPTSNSIWREQLGTYQCSCKDYQHYISGDTLIKGLVYQKIRRSGANLAENIQGFCTTQIVNYFNEYIGAYRNDNLNRKVYMVLADSVNEHLLYDFNINLWDTLHQTLLCGTGVDLYAISVDSILIGNEYRRRIGFGPVQFIPNYINGHFIEGIGTECGLLGNNGGLSAPFECGTWLLCFKQNNQTIYPDTTYICNPVITGIEKPAENISFKIIPIPVQQFATINFLYKFCEAQIVITDICGKIIERINHVHSLDRLDFGNISNGLYFITLSNNNQTLARTKIIKMK